MSQPPQGMRPPHALPQVGMPPQQFGPPSQQFGPPIGQVGYPVASRPARPPVHGWWTTSAVLAFIGAGSAASVLGLIAAGAFYVMLLVGGEGGGEAIRQLSDDVFSGAAARLWTFVGFQLVSVAVGFLAGLGCLRARTSGAVLTMLLGALGLGELCWCGAVLGASAGSLVMLVLAGVALVVCPVLALRHPQQQRRG